METEEKQKQDKALGQKGTIRICICNQTGKTHDASIWIIHDNQKNRKTSLWGTPSADKLDIGNYVDKSVIESPDGRYLIRVIDAAGLYYEANGILLKNGETIVMKDGSERMSATIEVHDKEGKIAESYDMFVASL